MITGPIIAEIAALVGDRARATMVSALPRFFVSRYLTGAPRTEVAEIVRAFIAFWKGREVLEDVKVKTL